MKKRRKPAAPNRPRLETEPGALGGRLKSPQLAEPLEGAPDFGHFQLMAAAELFEADAFEAGAFQGCFYQIVRLWGGDLIAGSAAQPHRHLEKARAGTVGLISFAEPVFVDSAQEKSADADRPTLGQHRTEDAAAF